MARGLLTCKGTEICHMLQNLRRKDYMMYIDLEKRDQMAYHALYYAIHGDTDRSEKIRTILRWDHETQERVPVADRQFVPVF